MPIQIIKMPDIGEGIAEVELVAWRVAVGEAIAEDQILADVMTDKATVEIPSHVAGQVVSLDATVGQVVPVGTTIIHIETAAEQLEQAPIATEKIAIVAPVPAPVMHAAMATPQHNAGSDRPIATPAVRRKAWELGIDLAEVRATGPAGRICHADLQAYVNKSSIIDSCSGNLDKRYKTITHEEIIPVIGLRRKIAQKMQEAKRRIPHFTYVEEIDVTELEALRTQLNAQHASTRGRLTLLPFLMHALVLAVRVHPQVNARYDDDAAELTRFKAVHLGVATQTEGGLMVPVIRHVENLDLWAFAAEVKRISEAARCGKVTREELNGSTITLTSLGALGGIVSTPVINHPEVAIVGTNRIVERPVILAGQVVARKMMNVSSSFDHRVVDGLHAAEFIQCLRRYLECPATLFVP